MLTLQDDQRGTLSLILDEEEIGLINYEDVADVAVVTHTEVDPKYQGKGYAQFLVQSFVDLTKLYQKKAGATCPYAVKYFADNGIENNAATA